MRTFKSLGVPMLLSLGSLVPQSAGAQETLYRRLGGYDAISAVVDEFADRLFSDAEVGRRFAGMSADSRAQFKQKNKNLVCNVTGGPCLIISRSAKATHTGLGISEHEFQVVVNHLVAVLTKYKVADKEQKELLGIIGTLKPDIVESR